MDGLQLLFPAIYKDGELLENTCDIRVNCSRVMIKGEQKKKAWDPINWCMRYVTGFFIEFEGAEYGTIEVRENDFINTCNRVGNCCGGTPTPPPGGDRIHVGQFAIEFV